ncbi:MAG TPA: hypothetical protein VJ957_06800 [Longimicrobiales bacterium]|nr:hypothetical protein [Longimicrobiales bacterium]
MSDFATATVQPGGPDPSKRVNYSFGLVLGVDEFVQEQTYLLAKHRLHNRALHGYGTVWGLKVDVPDDVDPPEVRVAPGLALSPAGYEICVPTVMCAKLGDWLTRNGDALEAAYGPPPFDLALCVVLCYRECKTDVVPLPGEPCRTEAETRAASRIQDSFELKLCLHDDVILSPPAGAEGDLEYCDCAEPSSLLRARTGFGQLLRRLDVQDSAASVDEATFLDDVRALADPPSWLSPPVAEPTIPLPPDQAAELIEAAARVWVTEVLPSLLAGAADRSLCAPPEDSCVRLATLRFTVAASDVVQGGAGGVTVDDAGRPLLLDTSVLQAGVLGGPPIELP